MVSLLDGYKPLLSYLALGNKSISMFHIPVFKLLLNILNESGLSLEISSHRGARWGCMRYKISSCTKKLSDQDEQDFYVLFLKIKIMQNSKVNKIPKL